MIEETHPGLLHLRVGWLTGLKQNIYLPAVRTKTTTIALTRLLRPAKGSIGPQNAPRALNHQAKPN